MADFVKIFVLAVVVFVQVFSVGEAGTLKWPAIGRRLDRIEKLLGISSSVDNTGCPANFRRFSNSCYHFGVAPVTWYMAKIACQQLGAKLVSVETYAEDDFILRNIKLLPESKTLIAYWTSGNDLSHNNHWIWDSTGQAFGNYRPWGPGQPNADRECLIYYGPDLWRWHDLSCTFNKYASRGVGFICEKNAE